MRYPEFINSGDVIGFIAPSFGCSTEPYVSCFNAALERFNAMGFRTACMALEADSIPLSEPRLKQEDKLAIYLGTEDTGLKKETISRSDYKVIIPMAREVDSLNVAAAAAVAFWELRKA